MNSFKEGRYDILVATDVAGRGLDVEGVTQVSSSLKSSSSIRMPDE